MPGIEIAQFGNIALDKILNTQLFDFDEAAQAPGWLKELRGEHTPETEEYGISSFVYRARRPFHPERFMIWCRLNGRESYVLKAFLVGCRTDIGLFMVTSGSNGSTWLSRLLVGRRCRRRLAE